MAVPGPDSKKGPVGNSHSPAEYKDRHLERWVQPQSWEKGSHNWSVGSASNEVAKIVRGALSSISPD